MADKLAERRAHIVRLTPPPRAAAVGRVGIRPRLRPANDNHRRPGWQGMILLLAVALVAGGAAAAWLLP